MSTAFILICLLVSVILSLTGRDRSRTLLFLAGLTASLFAAETCLFGTIGGWQNGEWFYYVILFLFLSWAWFYRAFWPKADSQDRGERRKPKLSIALLFGIGTAFYFLVAASCVCGAIWDWSDKGTCSLAFAFLLGGMFLYSSGYPKYPKKPRYQHPYPGEPG